MAYMCKYGKGECSSCGRCGANGAGEGYKCPVCGRHDSQWVYHDDFGEVLGCEKCVRVESVGEYIREYVEEHKEMDTS